MPRNLKVRLKDLPSMERPRERLMRLGPEGLSSAELLALLLGTGSRKESVLALANRLLARYDVAKLSALPPSELMKTFGVSHAKASALVAAFELGRRASIGSDARTKLSITNPADIARQLMPIMRRSKREMLKCVCLDAKARVLKHATVAIGGLNTNSVHPREVFQLAIEENAAAIILVHNHPSGDPTPSGLDITMTSRLSKAGDLLGIELLDHIIIGDGRYVSLKEEGLC
ncbi:RadC-like JAB domain protein [uncultured archaeon]|nr:RadC-like JAB domain protein [uncultured archaeon]